MKKLLLIGTALLTPALGWGEDAYTTQKREILSQMDECDLINAREVYNLGTIPVQVLKRDIEDIRTLFDTTREKRSECYSKALNKFKEHVHSGFMHYSEDDITSLVARQQELDDSLVRLLSMRLATSINVLDAMQDDIESAIQQLPEQLAEQNVDWENPAQEIFYREDEDTRDVIKEDMSILMEAERRQLYLDEVEMLIGDQHSTASMAYYLVKVARHHFSRAMLVYEDIHSQPDLLSLSRIRAEFAYGALKLGEIFAFAPTLEGLSESEKEYIRTIYRRARELNFHLDNAYDDMQAGIYDDDYMLWIGGIYNDISELMVTMQKTLIALSDNPGKNERTRVAKPKASNTFTPPKPQDDEKPEVAEDIEPEDVAETEEADIDDTANTTTQPPAPTRPVQAQRAAQPSSGQIILLDEPSDDSAINARTLAPETADVRPVDIIEGGEPSEPMPAYMLEALELEQGQNTPARQPQQQPVKQKENVRTSVTPSPATQTQKSARWGYAGDDNKPRIPQVVPSYQPTRESLNAQGDNQTPPQRRNVADSTIRIPDGPEEAAEQPTNANNQPQANMPLGRLNTQQPTQKPTSTAPQRPMTDEEAEFIKLLEQEIEKRRGGKANSRNGASNMAPEFNQLLNR